MVFVSNGKCNNSSLGQAKCLLISTEEGLNAGDGEYWRLSAPFIDRSQLVDLVFRHADVPFREQLSPRVLSECAWGDRQSPFLVNLRINWN